MNDYLEGPTVEALADDESGSVHADHSGCNTETTAYAQVPAKGVQPMPMHTSGELCMYACTCIQMHAMNNCNVLIHARRRVSMSSTTICVKMIP